MGWSLLINQGGDHPNHQPTNRKSNFILICQYYCTTGSLLKVSMLAETAGFHGRWVLAVSNPCCSLLCFLNCIQLLSGSDSRDSRVRFCWPNTNYNDTSWVINHVVALVPASSSFSWLCNHRLMVQTKLLKYVLPSFFSFQIIRCNPGFC